MRLPSLPAAASLVLLLAACDAAHAPPPEPATPPPAVHVSVAPPSATVVEGGRVTFAAAVANAAIGGVTWSVPGTSCGSVTQTGVYTAPASPATCSVVATSLDDSTSAGSATVQVIAPVAVAISPVSSAVSACKTLTFAATVTGSTDGSVTWSVQEGAAGGSVTAAGVYTAPATPGTYHVVATSHADPTKQAIAAVTVATKVLSVAVTPATTSAAPGGQVRFTATVTTTCGAFTSGG